MDPGAAKWVAQTKLYHFIATHPEVLGLNSGLTAWNLGLAPHHVFRSSAGGLQILRFTQTYRQIPVFGPDAVVRLIVAPGGVLGIRGTIVDGRREFCISTLPRRPMRRSQAYAFISPRRPAYLPKISLFKIYIWSLCRALNL